MVSRKRVAILAAAAMLALHALAGAQSARQERAVGGFDQIVWRAGGELRITQGPKESLIVEAEPRLLPKLLADVKGGVLELRFAEGSFSTTEPIRFHVTVKTLKSLQANGSGDIVIERLDTPSFGVELVGSGDMRIGQLVTQRLAAKLNGSSSVELGGGRATTQTVELKGSGTYDAAAFSTEESSVSIGGSGDVKVAASRSLVARISGSGEIQYVGDPRVVESVSGSGTVRKIGSR